MIVFDCLWLSMIVYDCLWLSMIVYDCLWLSMIVYDCRQCTKWHEIFLVSRFREVLLIFVQAKVTWPLQRPNLFCLPKVIGLYSGYVPWLEKKLNVPPKTSSHVKSHVLWSISCWVTVPLLIEFTHFVPSFILENKIYTQTIRY